MPINQRCKLIKKEYLKSDIVKFVVNSKEIAKEAKPRSVFRN